MADFRDFRGSIVFNGVATHHPPLFLTICLFLPMKHVIKVDKLLGMPYDCPNLKGFVGPKSWLVFDLLNPLEYRDFSKIRGNSVSNIELQMTIKW